MRSRNWTEHSAFHRNTAVRTRIGLSANHPSFRVGVLRTHLLTALLAAATARRAGVAVQIALRWDDTDPSRVNHAHEPGLLQELREGAQIPIADEELRQSLGGPRYRRALEHLRQLGVVTEQSGIPCLDAPAADRVLRRAGLDPRAATAQAAVNTGVGLDVAETAVPLVRSDGRALWHLASVVDDIHQQTTLIVRGSDKSSATAVQVRLFSLLGAAPPAFVFLPRLVDRANTRVATVLGQGIRPASLRWYLSEPFLTQGSGPPPLTFRDLSRRLRPVLPAHTESRFDGRRLAAMDRKLSGALNPDVGAEELRWASAPGSRRLQAWVAAHYRRPLPQQLRLCELLTRPLRHGPVPADAGTALDWLERRLAGGATGPAPPAIAWVLTGDPSVKGLGPEVDRMPEELLQARMTAARQALRRGRASAPG